MAYDLSPPLIGPLATKFTGVVIVGYSQLDGAESECSFVQPPPPPVDDAVLLCIQAIPVRVEREQDRDSNRIEGVGGRGLTATICPAIRCLRPGVPCRDSRASIPVTLALEEGPCFSHQRHFAKMRLRHTFFA